MIDAIGTMKGPDFLFFYFCYAVGTIILFRIVLRVTDDSRDRRPPSQTETDPFEIAVLRNGPNMEAIFHTILFDLWKKELIIISEDGLVYASPHADKGGNLTHIERDILRLLAAPKRPDAIIESPGIMERLKGLLVPVREGLVRKGLLLSAERIRRLKNIFWGFLLVLLFPAVIKIFFGISRDKPVFFLAIMMFAAVLFILFTYKKNLILTVLGRKYLQTLIKRYKAILLEGKKKAVLPGGIDPVLLAAIFGAGALVVFPQFNLYGETFHPGKAGTFSDGVSGGSCSSCSGGGGGDGGGGCGGCGD
jgi:uncharacterized protein (TIGR04222 family)